MIVKLLILIICSLWSSGLSLHALALEAYFHNRAFRMSLSRLNVYCARFFVQELKLLRTYVLKKVRWSDQASGFYLHTSQSLRPWAWQWSVSTDCSIQLKNSPCYTSCDLLTYCSAHFEPSHSPWNTATIFAQSLNPWVCALACEHNRKPENYLGLFVCPYLCLKNRDPATGAAYHMFVVHVTVSPTAKVQNELNPNHGWFSSLQKTSATTLGFKQARHTYLASSTHFCNAPSCVRTIPFGVGCMRGPEGRGEPNRGPRSLWQIESTSGWGVLHSGYQSDQNLLPCVLAGSCACFQAYVLCWRVCGRVSACVCFCQAVSLKVCAKPF